VDVRHSSASSHRSQPKVQLYLWRPSINAGALPIAISLEERQTAPYVWVHPEKAVPLDGPPGMRRPMRPRLYRHHLVGFIGIVVGHFHFGFGPGSERANLISSM
jgi:hypothetical protein